MNQEELKTRIISLRESIKRRRDLNIKETPLWWTLNGQFDIIEDIIFIMEFKK